MSRKTAPAALVLFVALAAAWPAGAADVVVVNPAAAYPEGPTLVGDTVYYAEMGADRVLRWDGTRNAAVWSRKGCSPTSVARGSGDSLVVLCHSEGALVRIAPDGQTLDRISRDAAGHGFVNPNASVNDARGGIYFSASGDFSPVAPATGAILYLDRVGTLRVVAEGIRYSNGVALSPDGKTLFASEHLNRRILAYDVAGDGSLSGTRVFLRLDDIVGADPARSWEVGPDGLAVDSRGNLYVAEYGGGRVAIVAPDGMRIAVIAFPEKYTTAPLLIDGERRIFVTAPVSLFDPAAYGKVYSVANPAYRAD